MAQEWKTLIVQDIRVVDFDHAHPVARASRTGSRTGARQRPGAATDAPAAGEALYGPPCGSVAAIPKLGRIIPYLGMFPSGIEKVRIGQKIGQGSRAGSQKARPVRRAGRKRSANDVTAR